MGKGNRRRRGEATAAASAAAATINRHEYANLGAFAANTVNFIAHQFEVTPLGMFDYLPCEMPLPAQPRPP
jgi:hypothetical protein